MLGLGLVKYFIIAAIFVAIAAAGYTVVKKYNTAIEDAVVLKSNNTQLQAAISDAAEANEKLQSDIKHRDQIITDNAKRKAVINIQERKSNVRVETALKDPIVRNWADVAIPSDIINSLRDIESTSANSNSNTETISAGKSLTK